MSFVATPAAALLPRLATAMAICALALLTFFQFPGRTWLQQDTQIYAPILQHLRDPSVLDRDLLVQYPHVTYTLYDELALLLEKVTGADLQHILGTAQIVCRAIGIWGIYLMATAAGLDLWGALAAAALFSLGAMIAGPSVLTFEYEPTPRALAVPLIFCALGFVSHRRYVAAGAVSAAAFLIHAPTTVPFGLVLLWLSRRDFRRTLPAWIALLASLVILLIAAYAQPGVHQQQQFFTRLTPSQEAVQRMRTAYNWISLWWSSLLPQYLFLYALGCLAFARVKNFLTPELRSCAIILPAMGMLSMPLSYLLLEQLKWSLTPQLQPMRVLLFVTAFAVILAALAAFRAKHLAESLAWLLLVFYIPMRVQLFDPPSWRIVLTATGLAAFTTAALRLPRQALLIAAVLAFFLIPGLGGVSNYPDLHTPQLAELTTWARANTSRDAIFLFPDAGRRVHSGIFRADAQRALYVDWKGGGQVNYLKDFADEWTRRWQIINRTGYGTASVPQYRRLGVDYLVLLRDHLLPGVQPVYLNTNYAVYRTEAE